MEFPAIRSSIELLCIAEAKAISSGVWVVVAELFLYRVATPEIRFN